MQRLLKGMQPPVERKSRVEIERETALLAAMDSHGGIMLAYFIGLTRDRHAAEELYQDLWTWVYQRFALEDFDRLPYLYQKAYQIFVGYYRKQQSRPQLSLKEPGEVELPAPTAQETGNADEEARLERDFWEMFTDLSFDQVQKQAFWLSARYGYTVREIGAQLGVSKTQAARTIADVKSQCADYLNRTGIRYP